MKTDIIVIIEYPWFVIITSAEVVTAHREITQSHFSSSQSEPQHWLIRSHIKGVRFFCFVFIWTSRQVINTTSCLHIVRSTVIMRMTIMTKSRSWEAACYAMETFYLRNYNLLHFRMIIDNVAHPWLSA